MSRVKKPTKSFEFDPNFKPFEPTLVLAEVIPGTSNKVVTKYFGASVLTDKEYVAAKNEIRYRAEQLAPIPVRERRERTYVPRVRDEWDESPINGNSRQRRERFTRKARGNAYA